MHAVPLLQCPMHVLQTLFVEYGVDGNGVSCSARRVRVFNTERGFVNL